MRDTIRLVGLGGCIVILGYGGLGRAQEAPGETGSEAGNETDVGRDGEAPSEPPAAQAESTETAAEVAEPSPEDQGIETPDAPSDTREAMVPETDTAPATAKVTITRTAAVPASQAAATPDDEEILTGTWTKHILFSTPSGSFRFQPRGWVQPRFRLAINGDDEYNSDEPFEGSAFSFQRARFGFQAWLFQWARVYLDTGWKSGGAKLIDFYVDLGPENGTGPIAVRLGFFRPYFVRQLLHATTQLAMVDYARAWTDPALGLGVGPSGRQLGVGLQGFVGGGFEYGIGVWNGADTFAEAPGTDFMGGVRVALHPLGLTGAGNALTPGNESDTAISEKPGLSIGAALYFEDRDDTSFDIPFLDRYEDRQLKLGVDLAFQYAGLALEGEMFLTQAWAEDPGVADLLSLAHLDASGLGAYFQAGYIINRRFELVGRFDMVDENIEIRGIRFYPTVGATVFIHGNNLKVQAQYRMNIGAGYEVDDVPGNPYIPLTHDLFFMVQAAI